LKDCLVLLKAHKVEEKGETESIDSSYVAKLLARDWGFWYTATNNLKKIKKFVSEMNKLGQEAEIDPSRFGKTDREEITEKIEELQKFKGSIDENSVLICGRTLSVI